MLNKDKVLLNIANRESGNRDIDSPIDNLGGWGMAKSRYQFRKSTWNNLGYNDNDITNPNKVNEAASKLYDSNYNTLTKKLGREPTEGEMDYAWHYGAVAVKGGEKARGEATEEFKPSEYKYTYNIKEPYNTAYEDPTNQSNQDTYYDNLIRDNLSKNGVNPNVIAMLLGD